MTKPIFRQAALEKRHTKWMGEIVMVRPLSVVCLTSIAFGMALLVICFFFLCDYSARSTISGQLAPDVGVIKVYSAQRGVVVQKLGREGRAVKKGEVLYVISSERQTSSAGDVETTISRQVALRQQSIREEISHTRRLQQDEDAALRKKIDGLEAEQSNIVRQLEGQRLRIGLAEAGAKRADQMRSLGYVSAEMAQQKQADLLDQKNRLEALERDRLNTASELVAQRSALSSLPLRQHNDMAQLERLLASTDQEWAESEGRRRIEITAPAAGITTALVADVGQTVDSGRLLASVIPAGAILQAHLYAPSRAVGFIRPADRVLLRYQAFPYQKFGHATGTVIAVSRTAQPANEMTGATSGSGEPVYLITVALARQSVTAYGKPQPLQAGMLVDADILQEKRRLYEWVLEPLYSLSGKL